MCKWFTPQDLAGRPGLPGSDRGIRKKAQREGWQSRKRQTGQGLEYSLSSLPLKTQATFGKINGTNKTIENPSTDNIGARLRSERKRLGLTQVSMSKIAGCSSCAWQGYELGKSIPGGKLLANLHQQGIDIAWILTGDKHSDKYISTCGMSSLEMAIFELAIKTSYECRDIIDNEISSMTQAVLIGGMIQLMMRRES